jgi:hypothetical protein
MLRAALHRALGALVDSTFTRRDLVVQRCFHQVTNVRIRHDGALGHQEELERAPELFRGLIALVAIAL